MKKKRIFLMVTCVLMLVFSVSAYAVNYSGEGKKRGVAYNIRKVGANSVFHGVGTKEKAYTTVTSSATNNIYMTASVQRYKHGDGVYTTKQDACVVEPGLQLGSGKVERPYTNDIYDFYHGGESYSTSFQSSFSRVDIYSYKAKQYYE